MFAAGYVLLATTSSGSTYPSLVLAMFAIGTGFGLVIPPTTEAIMSSVPREMAGVASGTTSANRQIGTAIGVAIVGSLLVSGYRSRLDDRISGLSLSRASARSARVSVGDALRVARGLGGGVGRTLESAAREGFVHGMNIGMAACAVLALIGAALALRFLPSRTPVVSLRPGELPLAVFESVD